MYNIHPFLEKMSEPALLYDTDLFLIKIATTEAEREQAFKLRYEIFNLEQGKGLDHANEDGLDKDRFDSNCLHLLVLYKPENRVIGTYRAHPGPVAYASAEGYYSSMEYRIEGLKELSDQLIELGRSCVHPDFRNGAVVSLLWSAIAGLSRRAGLPYLMGCVSLEVNEPAAGWALHEYFRTTNRISNLLFASPMPGYELERSPQAEVDAIFENKREMSRVFPPLLKGYMRLGAHICGEPVYDFEFKSIDFLIILDARSMPEKYFRHYYTAD